MGYINTYWLDCEDDLNYNSACIDFEFGKVRQAALIRKSYLSTVLANPVDPDVWTEGVEKGLIFFMPKVSGDFDPGEPVALKGYGKRLFTRGPREMVLTFSDPSFILNYNFYNRIQTFTDLVPAFRSETQMQIADKPADVFAKDIIEEDVETVVAWEVKATWRGVDLPYIFDASVWSVFDTPINNREFSDEFSSEFN